MNTKFKACLFLLLIVCLDQISKWFVIEHFMKVDGIPMDFVLWFQDTVRVQFNRIEILPFLDFVMVWNEGISFGLLNGSGDNALLLSGVAIGISLGLLIWLFRTNDTFVTYVLAMIVGGALGNVIDRLRFGAVADFIDVHVGEYHWPAFNVADSAITIGVIMLLAYNIFFENKREKP